MDMSTTIAPKSDQLNADDLFAGPRVVTITRVAKSSGADQPVDVFFEGDGGKPYRPCKSMRRVMVDLWGKDATQYVGRSMTLYRDPKVTWGGMEVGGIRISHMSHIEREKTIALTATKKSRAPFTVKPLKVEEPKPAEDVAANTAADLIAAIDATTSHAALEEITSGKRCIGVRARLAEVRPELADRVTDAITSRLADFDRTDADEGIPA